MPSQFPAALDDLPDPSGGQLQSATPVTHSQLHGLLNSAVEALEAKVGVDGSADPDSLDARVAALEGAAGHVHVWGETPAGSVNGSNAAFTLAAAPAPAESLMLFVNGLLQRAGGHDFTLSGAAVTFAAPPEAGSVLLAHYVVEV